MILYEIFDAREGRTVTVRQCSDLEALTYATALGSGYDYRRAGRGFYVSRSNGRRTEILTACYPTRFDAQRRADFENMASDVCSFAVIEAT